MSPLCYLHIGKTAGTYIRSVAGGQDPVTTGTVRLCAHAETAETTAKKFPGRTIAFTFRDPVERFISAFDSRLRNGRPVYSSLWSDAEAITFGAFRTPNSLAEALDSSDEYSRSAAAYGMHAISHLRRGYAHYFKSPAALEAEVVSGSVVACVDVADLDRLAPAYFAAMGLSHVVDGTSDIVHHRRSDSPEPLSPHAESNLRRVWATEFVFYEQFRSIAKDLNLGRT